MVRGREKRERVFAALAGEPGDRVPVTAWGHILPDEIDAGKLAEATVAFANEFDWDWIKVNPRATWFAEGWGWKFDFTDYHGVIPRLSGRAIEPFDPDRLEPADISHPVWRGHLGLLNAVKKGLDGVPFVQTIFSPLSVLAFLAGKPTDHSQDGAALAREEAVLSLIRTQPEKAHRALGVIAESLAKLASASVDAGADGIFFAITRLAREGRTTAAEYREFGKPYDLKVLEAVRSAEFNILHTCGPRVYWDDVASYPVHAVNWATVGQGNLDVGEAKRSIPQAVIGGIDEATTLLSGTPEDVRREARAAIRRAGNGRFLLAPGCSIDPAVPKANLRALREAAEG